MREKTVAIIADSQVGPFFAHLCEKSGYKTVLVSSQPSLDSTKLKQNEMLGRISHVPADDIMRASLEKIQSFYAAPVVLSEYDYSSHTYSGTERKPFLGFGDSKSLSVPILSRYTSRTSKCFELNPLIIADFYDASACLNGKSYYHSEVTQIHFSDSKIDKITINGNQEIHADLFIFLNSPRDYFEQLPGEIISSKIKSRVAKSPLWTRVALSFAMKESIEDLRELVFMVPDNTDVEPGVGQTRSTHQNEFPFVSVWETYLEHSHSEDPELLTSTLRQLRRWAKKAVPQLESTHQEAIVINPKDQADYSWLSESREIREISKNAVFSTIYAYPHLGLGQAFIAACDSLQRLDQLKLLNFRDHEVPNQNLDHHENLETTI